tara:strand:+ start:95 stop:754 length:660 start_codon:yes stop_codon:yes gene_type:complete
MKRNSAILFGGSGLTGNFLLDYLTKDSNFDSITVVSRKKIKLQHKKLQNKVINFSNTKEIENCITKNSIVFSCIGTTNAKVNGDKIKYKKVDFDITINIAKSCKKKNAKKFLFISSAGSNSLSSNFYLKLKGEIEESVIEIYNSSLFIFKPSLLLGSRKDIRIIEKIGQVVMSLFSFLLPKKIKAINSSLVAKAMLDFSISNLNGVYIIENKEIINHFK